MNRYLQIGLALVLVGGIGFAVYRGENEKQALKLNLILRESENRLLKDQLSETEYKAQSARTYEEGLTDGLMRSKNIGYADGYHAAMNQVSEEKQAAEDKKKSTTVTNNNTPAPKAGN